MFFAAIAIALLAGCSSIGPRLLPANQYSYNEALSQSMNQEMLLNLVRMKYEDSPYFLDVTTISSSMRLDTSLAGTASMGKTYHNTGLVTRTLGASIDPSVAYSDNPTVIYAPVTGEKLTRQFLIPLDVIDIGILIRSDWSIARILRVCAQELGNYENAPGATRPGVSEAPKHYKNFIYLAHAIRAYQKQDLLIEKFGHYKGKRLYIDLLIKPGLSAKLAHMLRLPVGSHHIRLLPTNNFSTPPGFVRIKFRSLMGVMYYLSKGITAPPQDYKSGVLQTVRDSKGRIFNWHSVLRGMMHISSSLSKPPFAAVSINYRNRWFFIADNDSNSKETLVLLGQIMSLQAKRQPNKGPGVNINV